MYRGINGALIGSFLWMLGTQAIDAEWYTVPSGGQVTFTLTELWAIGKGTPSSSYVEGEAHDSA